MPLLVIGNKNYSSWSLRPWLLLRHFAIPFEEKRLNLDTPEFHAEIVRWSPTKRVPVLHDDGLLIWDSLAICEYANERWLAGRGWPQHTQARAQARAAAAEMHSGFTALRSQLPFNSRRKPDRYRWDAGADADIARIQELWHLLRSTYGGDGDFLCGDFSIVDAMFAPVAVRFRSYGVALDLNAEQYSQALFDLPAMREWMAAAETEVEHIEATDALATP